MKMWNKILFSCLALFMLTLSLDVDAQRSRSSGADSEEGWIIRRTDKGIIKVPRRQKFRLEGSDVSANVERPYGSVLGTRPSRRNTSLIPVRTSFRDEFLSVSGLSN
jgi:hypothetical protein